jgi:hypothetical protein
MNRLHNSMLSIFIVFLLFMMSGQALYASSESDDVLAEIERLATADDSSGKGVDESIVERIESNASAVTKSLLPRLADAKSSEKQLAVYVWALGLAKDPQSTDPVIALSKSTKSAWVKKNCWRALAAINTPKTGEFLLATLDVTKEKESRYDLFDLLAEMKYEAILPRTEEVLKLNPDQYHWQSVMIFGKMGDKSVPFLMKKITHPDPYVRKNAISVLGIWMLAKEAAQPLREQFWKEKDPNIRLLILSSLERVTPDPRKVRKFSAEVVAKEKEGPLAKFAQETMDQYEKMVAEMGVYKKGKNVSPEEFKKQYDEIYKSAGKKGDYDILRAASSLDDEPGLKRLRERILQRNSDECFSDYQKINSIILSNRMIQNI